MCLKVEIAVCRLDKYSCVFQSRIDILLIMCNTNNIMLNSKSKFHKEILQVCMIAKGKYSSNPDGKVLRLDCLTAINVSRYQI